MPEKILVLNPGSQSTKIAMYFGGEKKWQKNIEHTPEEIKKYPTVYDQLDMRYDLILKTVAEQNDTLADLSAVAARGGPAATFKSGGYEVSDELIRVAREKPISLHVANIAMAIGKRIADPLGIKCYIYDAVTVDEMIPVTKLTGLREMSRVGLGHTLNMRAAALKHCQQNGLDYYGKNILVAHLGGGITISLHGQGTIIDMISDDEGPYAPERSGGLPIFQLIKECFSGSYTEETMFKRVQRAGGLMAHLGVTDVREVEKKIMAGDQKAKLVYEAMALNVAKNIAKLAVTVNGQIDVIILTGGIAHSDLFVGMVANRVKFLAPVSVLPGENEMEALALGVGRILKGEERANLFS
ncbi:MAG: butyrate kinase [Deltaproteobacteria bacterium]|jgi:butyrate kinase|nr:butyrate kinase [Deltaproteobacteria bacterium]